MTAADLPTHHPPAGRGARLIAARRLRTLRVRPPTLASGAVLFRPPCRATRIALPLLPVFLAPANMKDFRLRPTDSSAATQGAWSLQTRPRSFVLLAGAVNPNSLPALVGRSVLDLPVDDSWRLLDVWARRIGEFVGVGEFGAVPEVLLLVGESSPMPSLRREAGNLRFRVERDSSEYRGTAGALRDLCEGFRDEDHILVGNASQCPDAGLIQQLVAQSDPSDGVTVSTDPEGAPSGLMLVRCGALRQIPSIGYMDLKEQALPRIAKQFGARVVVSQVGGSPPIRSLRHYLEVVRSWRCHKSLRGLCAVGPFEERWAPAFSIVEDGAKVAESAKLYDSVVLAGGVIESGCEVVRSVVSRGGVVRRSGRVLDQLVIGSGLASAGPSVLLHGESR